MPVVQSGNGGHIGTHKARHAEFSPQHLRQKLPVGGHRLPVYGIIGAHGVPGAALHKGFLKHWQAPGENLMPSHCGGRTVQPAHRRAVTHIMLRLRRYAVLPFQIPALHSLYDFTGKFPTQKGILPKGFLHPSVPGIPGEIHHRAEGFMHAVSPGLRRNATSHPPSQRRLKGSRQRNLLGKTGCIFLKQPMQRFLTEKERDSQPGFLHCPALQLIGQPRRTAPQLHASYAHAAHGALHFLPIRLRYPPLRRLF